MKLTQSQLSSLIDNSRLSYNGKDLYGICPYCQHDEFGISLKENHVFNCFRKSSCGETGNIYKLLKHLGRSAEFMSEVEADIFGDLPFNFSGLLNEEKQDLDLSLPVIQPPVLWKRVYEDEYLESRGLTSEQFAKFEIGVSPLNKGYITFLVRMRGDLVGHVTRSKKDKKWIDNYNRKIHLQGSKSVYLRYKNSKTDFGKCLFGYDEIVENETKDVILVEGILDKTKTDLNLQLDDQKAMKCCATFGAKFSDYHVQLLKNKGVETLYFMFESDILNKVKQIVSNASIHFNVRVAYLDYKDPNEFDSEECYNVLSNTTNFLDFNMRYCKSNLTKI